jgi:hypothetical protein
MAARSCVAACDESGVDDSAAEPVAVLEKQQLAWLLSPLAPSLETGAAAGAPAEDFKRRSARE